MLKYLKQYEFNSGAKIDVEDFKLNNCVRWTFTQKRQEEKQVWDKEYNKISVLGMLILREYANFKILIYNPSGNFEQLGILVRVHKWGLN